MGTGAKLFTTSKKVKNSAKMKLNSKEVVLNHINSQNIYGYSQQFDTIYDLITKTVKGGGLNSVLLLGPRGVGKSLLVNLVLQKAREEIVFFRKDGLTVSLHGLLETDDKLALKQIARQLKLENVDGDRVFGSFAEHLEFLLSSLKSGDPNNSKPIVFVLEEFHLFCSHHNQTLLYNLFDMAQTRATPMVVIGISPELDVLESLEKRVRSRFNHRQIEMFPPKKFEEYVQIAKDLLSPAIAGNAWIKQITNIFEEKSLKQTLNRMYNINCSVANLKQILSLAIISSADQLTSKDIIQAFEEQSESGEPTILAGLTLIEICILIAIKHIQVIYDGQPFNFEMVFHEFDKYVSTKNSMLKQERPVVMKAWETLIELEIITPVDKGTKIQKEFKLHNLQVFPETILKAIDGVPQNVREWATSSTFA